ncbi:MAG TPA: enoyl-CoA hydratase/isomerase family protein [Bacillota bacterium]
MTEPSFQTIRYERRPPAARIILNRPEVRNAITLQMAEELHAALLAAGADERVRVVVLTGADPAFCSGIDLVDHRGKSTLEFRTMLDTLYRRLQHAHATLGKPTIAALNGPARGAGCTMAFMCDMIVAADTASLGLPEVDRGLLPAYHLAYLPRLIGKPKAFELAFTGDPISAAEAERLGIVNRVVPRVELDAAVDALVARLAGKSPLVMRIGKDAFYRVMDVEFEKAIAIAADALAILAASADTQEGLTAFAEKRSPEWGNR